MRVGAGRAGRGLMWAALLAGALTACSGGSGEAGRDAGASESAPADPAKGGAAKEGSAKAGAVKSGGTVGAAGSACELPVTFDIAEDWEAEAIDAAATEAEVSGADEEGSPEDELAEAVASVLRQGPVSAACEVDAKPAGHIGFLRVWTGEPGEDDPRAVLKAFVAAEDGNGQERYSTFEANGVAGAEVRYVHTSELLDETKKERAFAVVTGSGPVVVHLGGMDTEEHENMLPAYELARSTLRAG
ncbi:lipoprotein [Streptomyces sp. NPDC093094]|uniref:lipoprotein n=1 Tax=Streptomyces sp. NPDC093094 TaxID=3366026 RepID=UPI003811ED13